MMQIGTKAEYGMRCLLRLAQRQEDTAMSLTTLAKEESLPRPYAEQILLRLKRAGFVRSTRGTQGGFTLAMAPSAITVGAVVRTLEGAPVNNICDHFNRRTSCGQTGDCNLRGVWDLVSRRVWETLDSITLEQLRRGTSSPAERMTIRLPVILDDSHSSHKEGH